MACPTVTLEGITPDVMECLRREAKRLGVPSPDDEHGTVSAYGATAEYHWDEGAATLQVTFTKTPEGIGCAMIEQRMRQAARACGGS